MRRPASIAFIAWVALASGVLLAAAGVTGLLGMPRFELRLAWDIQPLLARALNRVQTVSEFLRDSRIIPVLELALGAFLVLAAVGLFRLRAWARLSLEALVWLALVYVVAYGVLYFPARAYLTPWSYADLLPAILAVTFPFLAIFGYGTPLVCAILLLRSQAAREAVTRPGEPS